MNPADRVREAARAEFEKWASTEASPILEIGRFDDDTLRHYSSEYREPSTERAWEVWQAALALPVDPAKPDEVGMARDKVVEAAKRWERDPARGLSRHLSMAELVDAVDALLAAERAAKEGG